MANPTDHTWTNQACKRASEVGIAADQLVVCIEAGGHLWDGIPDSLIRAKQQIDHALEIHRERVEAEYQSYVEKARAA